MDLVLTIGAFVISFMLVMISIPSIIRVAHAKHLFEPFSARKVHTKVVPPMGGVAIFIGFTISSIIATDGISFDALKYIIASVIIMFFIGLKDDLMDISAKKKLIIQVFAAIILIALGNVRFTNMHGILGFTDIGFGASLILSLFAMVVIINAFNLIDGIDGLASGLAILAASTFGSWFYLSGHPQFAILSFALVGSLVGFFIYNVFGKRNKLFMGDTGSLIIGLIISALVVKFNEFNINNTVPYAISAAPALSFAIIIVPLIDTLRVMTIRISNKKSPFAADKNHIHHRLLKLVKSHFKVTMIIVAANAFIIAFAILLNFLSLNVNFQFILIFLLGVAISFIPSIVLRIKSTEKVKATKPIEQYS
ncbi:MraY family glycosyltransferase [Draconibacterium sp.]|jgi:UDP-N-acetylmuramyl pentapeptide phosphotransferase/UDP-N-acetylglucosamine-1-phosphate transferase